MSKRGEETRKEKKMEELMTSTERRKTAFQGRGNKKTAGPVQAVFFHVDIHWPEKRWHRVTIVPMFTRSWGG